MSIRPCFLFILFLIPSCFSHKEKVAETIIECNNIVDIYNHIKPNEYNKDTLVLFDVDNTIITAQSHLGSDQWFEALYKREMEQTGKDVSAAVHAILPQYKMVLMNFANEKFV